MPRHLSSKYLPHRGQLLMEMGIRFYVHGVLLPTLRNPCFFALFRRVSISLRKL